MTNGNCFLSGEIKKPRINIVSKRNKLEGRKIPITNAIPYLDSITIFIYVFHPAKNPFIICKFLFSVLLDRAFTDIPFIILNFNQIKLN